MRTDLRKKKLRGGRQVGHLPRKLAHGRRKGDRIDGDFGENGLADKLRLQDAQRPVADQKESIDKEEKGTHCTRRTEVSNGAKLCYPSDL